MTTYTNIFGGSTIKPADVSYSTLSLTSNQTLSWPSQGSSPFTSAIVEVTPDTAGRTLKMPDARHASPGEMVTFKNVGADSFSLLDNSGNAIVTIASGTAYTVYLRSNASAAGTWSYWQAGAGSSNVDAASLDGAGLEASAGLLRTRIVVNSFSTSQAFSEDHRSSFNLWTGGSGTFTMPDATSVGEGWFIYAKNDGSGTLQIAAANSETFDGDSDITLSPGESVLVVCDGTNFTYHLSGGAAGGSDFTFTSISVAGSGNYTLSAAEYAYRALRFTGALTGDRNIIVPASVRDYWVDNSTSGSYDLTVKTSGGTGVVVTQGKAATVYCDGTNVVAADDDYPSGLSTPIAVSDGGTGAATADAALDNLGGTTVGKQVFTAADAASARSALSGAKSGANTDLSSVYLGNTGLKIKDTDASHGLTIKPGSDLTADKTLTVTTGDADRTLTLSGNLTVNGATTISSAGAALIDDADAAAQRTTLGVPASTDIVGKQTIWVPKGAMTKRTTNGAAGSSEELATNDVMVPYWAFDSSASEAVQALIRMPKSWNEGGLEFEFHWKHPATTVNFGVKWGVRAQAYSNDDALDGSWGTEQEVADTGGTTSDLYISDMTSSLTVGGTPAAGDLVAFEFYRDPADASDTLAVDAHLIGVTIIYTTDAAKDD